MPAQAERAGGLGCSKVECGSPGFHSCFHSSFIPPSFLVPVSFLTATEATEDGGRAKDHPVGFGNQEGCIQDSIQGKPPDTPHKLALRRRSIFQTDRTGHPDKYSVS